MATLLSGRYITIDMLPLFFHEYWQVVSASNQTTHHEAFNDYLRFGSFPYVTMLAREDVTIKTYMDGIYNTILIKDVA